jgi:hypothetical protein
LYPNEKLQQPLAIHSIKEELLLPNEIKMPLTKMYVVQTILTVSCIAVFVGQSYREMEKYASRLTSTAIYTEKDEEPRGAACQIVESMPEWRKHSGSFPVGQNLGTPWYPFGQNMVPLYPFKKSK